MDKSGTFANDERRVASDVYHKLVQITRSMDEYQAAEIELRLPGANQT